MKRNIQRIALTPAYRTCERLPEILKELNELGFAAVTVNDGSGGGYEEIFEAAGQWSAVLEHKVNCGKGSAIKTGLCYIAGKFREPYTAVTLDADGQHPAADALRVCEAAEKDPEALAVGCRPDADMPLFRRVLGLLSDIPLVLACGSGLALTNTGLRAFSDRHTDRLLSIGGDRYDYEINVLTVYARAGIGINRVMYGQPTLTEDRYVIYNDLSAPSRCRAIPQK